MHGHTVIAKKAKRFLGLDRNEGSDEVVDDGCDEHNEQEDLGLQKSTFTESVVTPLIT